MKIKPVQDRILELLRNHKSMSAKHIAIELDMPRKSVDAAIWRMHRFNKTIYVIDHDRNTGVSGRLARIYAIGNKEDAPTPKAMTYSELSKRYRAKMKILIKLRRSAKINGSENINRFAVILSQLRIAK